ncbi:MAG TPA: YdcF family protein [Terriglobales bacterium]|nr:YdcF family protein [Terriglobales bacterium]
MKKLLIALLVIVTTALIFIATSGGFLVIDTPQHSDMIVTLAGETDRRPARALELLRQHLAPRVLLDVPAGTQVYGVSALQLARQYLDQLPQKDSVTVCPIFGLSTKTEARDVARCLQPWKVHSVLVVTSDYHSRRALSTFRHELPGYQVSVAAAYDPEQFGSAWWQHRQWAKQNLSEWVRLAWWECIDRWR